jgi:hypothetical protein
LDVLDRHAPLREKEGEKQTESALVTDNKWS